MVVPIVTLSRNILGPMAVPSIHLDLLGAYIGNPFVVGSYHVAG